MKGSLHNHSQVSRYDSTMNVEALCKRAKECGYKAIALTDHGTLTGIDDFIAAAGKYGIKPIPGVEAYMQEDDSEYKRFHLILMALDDIGYQGIAKAVTESNTRIDSRGFPRMNKEILERYFAKGKKYHGHVIATSACAGGVLAGLLLSPFQFDKEIQKLMKRQQNYEKPASATFIQNQKALEKKEAYLEELRIERDRLNKVSKRAFKKKEKDVEKQKGKETYEEALAELNHQKQETEAAKEELEKIKVQIALTNRDISSINARIKDSVAEHEKYNSIQEKINELESHKPTPAEIYQLTKEEALYYKDLFGNDNFYIEIQYHGYNDENGIPIEEISFTSLAKIAKELDIKIVAANDAHMPDGSNESIRARQIIRSIRTAKQRKVVPVEVGDREIYIKTEAELREALKKVLTESEIDEAITNAYDICERCHCTFKKGLHYPKYQNLKPGETAESKLRDIAYESIFNRFPGKKGWTKKYADRLEYELNVIAKMGYCDYFLIVQDFLEFGRKLGHLTDEDLNYLTKNVKSLTLRAMIEFVESHQKIPGFVVGAGRGSAAGSLVAYLIGITDIIDPLQYDLLFERFLNEDRVTMPDVDSDFSPDIRDLVVEYCKKLYGIETVANIVTKGYMAPRSAVRNVARIIGIEKDAKDYYLDLADKIAKMIPAKPGISFASGKEELQCENILRAAFASKTGDDKKTIQYKKDANEIIDQAKLVEGAFINYGMHAAGVIIADGKPISDYIPLMRDDKSGDMKVQCDMIQAEDVHGLLKFDFLGLNNLKIVTMAVRSIKERTGVELDIRNLPFDPKVFKGIFASGKTGSVFQFESNGMKRMLREANPTCLEDLIALVSLYRPGPMDFIPKYIEQKAHPERIKYLCPELKPILEKTYGVIVYQEQVMEIVQKLAGYSLSQADNVRRFMSKKKMKMLELERNDFIYGNDDPDRQIEGCVHRGIKAEIANEIFDQMIDFAKYAFNKSHAAAYAVLSYITAYIKYFYPADYMCAVLNCSPIKKIPSILNDCREIGIEVMPPEINMSGIGFTIYEGKILFGLDSIKGTKIASVMKIIHDRTENGNFVSFKEFLRRKIADKSTIENLIKAGAMDEFHPNRHALMNNYNTSATIVKKIVDKEAEVKSIQEDLSTNEDPKLIKKLKKAEDTLVLLNKQFDVIRIVDTPENLKARVKAEKEVLGFFVSAHPLDEYRTSEELGCIAISELEETRDKVDIMGLIEDLRLTARKSDGKPMAFFNLEDKTGTIEVCCFTKQYEQYGELVEEDAVVRITGDVNEKEIETNNDAEEDDSDEKEVYLNFVMDSLKVVHPDLNDIRVAIKDISEWNHTLEQLRHSHYICESGHPLTIYDELNSEFRKTYFYIKEEILEDKTFTTMKSA